MELSREHIDIINAKICPYCKSFTRVSNEEYVYGRTYKDRDVIICSKYPLCDSYVGTHDDGKPLGRLANKSLRLAKKEAHKYFDKLWKEKHIKRSYAYKLMSLYLGIPPKYTHIGMFKESTCKDVAQWADFIYKQQVKRSA